MGDSCICCLTGPVAHHRIKPSCVGKTDCFKGICQRPDLVWFDENAVCCVHLDSLQDTIDLCHKYIVSADKASVANLVVELCKSVKIIFVKGIFNIHQVVRVNQLSNVCYLVFSSANPVPVLVTFRVPHLA